jgi:hypothetical protein
MLTITQGLLWYDDNPSRTPEETIKRAADRYEIKYGKKPNRCYVNNGTPGLAHVQESAQALGIQVEAASSVLPYHFWIGILELQKATESV